MCCARFISLSYPFSELAGDDQKQIVALLDNFARLRLIVLVGQVLLKVIDNLLFVAFQRGFHLVHLTIFTLTPMMWSAEVLTAEYSP